MKKFNPFFCAIIHFCISLKTDTMLAFRINEYTIKYIILKIIFAILLLCLWNFVFYIFKEVKEGNKWVRAGIIFFLWYWILMSIIMLCIWPGNWIWDDIFIYEDAVGMWFNPWQHILTSVYYILSLMVIPIPAGIVICQYTIISGIVAVILMECYKKFQSKKLVCFMYIPFFLFPVMAHNFYPLRLSLYAFLELFFLFQFYNCRDTAIKYPKKFWIRLVIINIILTTWRSEGIFFLILGPALAFGKIRQQFEKKAIIIFSSIIFAGVIIINGIQDFYIGEQKNYYGLTAYIESIDDLIKYEYLENPGSELLDLMSEKVDLESIISESSGEKAFWNGAYAGLSTSDDYTMMKEIYISLIKKHPLPWIQERLLTFLTTSACTPYSCAFVRNSSEINVPEFFNDYILTEPINSTLRKNVLNLLSGRTSSMDGVNIMYRIFYNIIPSAIICFLGLFTCLRKRNYSKGICYFTLVLHFVLVFVAAPGVYFMYYLPIYLCGYVFLTYEYLNILYVRNYIKSERRL